MGTYQFNRREIGLSIALGVAVSACAMSTDIPEKRSGLAVVTLKQTPPDVNCLRIEVAGRFHVDRLFDVTPGEDAVLTLDKLPVGEDTFSGLAYADSCDAVTDDSEPTWRSDPVQVTVSAGRLAKVSLRMHRTSGQAEVEVDFEDYSDAGLPVDGGAQDSGAAQDAGVCAPGEMLCADTSKIKWCGADGQWETILCPSPALCENGRCECDYEGETACRSSQPFKCLSGRWEPYGPRCVEPLGQCYSDQWETTCGCTQGDMACNGSIVQICDPDWEFLFLWTEGYRDVGRCSGSCVADNGCEQPHSCMEYGATRRQNGSIQMCWGEWIEIGSYDQPCQQPGSQRCHNGFRQRCEEDGTWLNIKFGEGCAAPSP
jgi:hypothetical protein